MRTVSVSLDGNWLAANVANARVQFYEVTWDGEGAPIAAAPRGAPVVIDGRIATGRWTPDGRHFLISGVGGGGGMMESLFRRHGDIHVLAPPAPDAPARLVASTPAGVFPEGFEISDDGTRIAASPWATYLPEVFSVNYCIAQPWRRPPRSGDGRDETPAQIHCRSSPEGVIFDETGHNLPSPSSTARAGPPARFIDFIPSETGKLVAQDRTSRQRGPHDLVGYRRPENIKVTPASTYAKACRNSTHLGENT